MRKLTNLIAVLLFAVLPFLLMNSCQKEELLQLQNSNKLKSGITVQNQQVTYWGTETFTRAEGQPVTVKMKIGSEDLQHFANSFVLKLKNGDGTLHRVSSAIIKVNGKVIFGTKDFSLEIACLEKEISGLTENSEIEVELRSGVGSFLDVWIEGILEAGHAQLNPEGGEISLLNDQFIFTIPENAVDKTIYISVKDITLELPEQIKDKLYMAFELLPKGLVFDKPINLKINIPENIQMETVQDFGQLILNDGIVVWHDAEIDDIERTVTTQLNHFSLWCIRGGKLQNKAEPYTYNLYNIPSNSNIDKEFLLENDIYRAFKRWEAYTKNVGITFKMVDSDNPDILIIFIDEDNANTLLGINLFDGASAVVTWDVNSDRRQILLNNQTLHGWTYNGSVIIGEIVERVVEHEIGHYLGMFSDKVVNIGIMATSSNPNAHNFPDALCVCKEDLAFLIRKNPEISENLRFSTASKIDFYDETKAIQSVQKGTTLNNIKVKVSDSDNKGIPNVTVQFKITGNLESGNISLDKQLVLTDDNGIATMPDFSTPQSLGTLTITAISYLEPYINEVGNYVSIRNKNFEIKLISDDNQNEKIYFTKGNLTNTEYGIFSINPDGTGLKPIIYNAGYKARMPRISPDGTKIAFQSNYGSSSINKFQVWVSNVDGSGPYQVTSSANINNAGGSISWLPNGQYLYVDDYTTGGPVRICKTKIDGSEFEVILSGVNCYNNVGVDANPADAN